MTNFCSDLIMPVTTTCVSILYEVDIEVNLGELDFESNILGRQITNEIKILDYFYGTLLVHESDGRYNLTLIMYGVEKLQPLRIDLAVEPFYGLKPFDNQMARIRERNSIGPKEVKQIYMSMDLTPVRSYGKKLKTINGTIRISFEASKGQILKQTLIQGFSAINEKCSSKDAEKVKIICDNTTTTFDKNMLCSISDVFKTMFENPNNIESQNGTVRLEEVDPSTVEALQRLLCDHTLREEDLNISMLLFADRYNIKPIFELCSNHLMKNMTRENFVEIAKVADMTNASTLFKAVAEFIYKNIGTFEDDPELRKFMGSNPECFAKVLETMMFRK